MRSSTTSWSTRRDHPTTARPHPPLQAAPRQWIGASWRWRLTISIALALLAFPLAGGCGGSDPSADGGGAAGAGDGCDPCVSCMMSHCSAEREAMCGTGTGPCASGPCTDYFHCIDSCEQQQSCGCSDCGCTDQACAGNCTSSCQSSMTTQCSAAFSTYMQCTMASCQSACANSSSGSSASSSGWSGNMTCADLEQCCGQVTDPDALAQCQGLLGVSPPNDGACALLANELMTAGLCSL